MVLSASFSSSTLANTRPRLSSTLLSIEAMMGLPCTPRGSVFFANAAV
jgi:hypothetical protein